MTEIFDAFSALKARLDALRQGSRSLRLSFPKNDGPTGVLMVANRLDADEGLSCDFQFTVEVLADKADIELKDVLGRMVTLEHAREDKSVRYFNGYVCDFRFVKNDGGFSHFSMVLRPWLAFLRYRRDNAMFHGKTIEEQTTDVFSEYESKDWKVLQLGDDEPMTDACLFDETHYNYVHRRWEAKGWHYWYEHRQDGHTLVLCGDSRLCLPIDGPRPAITWQGKSGVKAIGLSAFAPVRTVASTLYSASSFDFKNPRPVLAQVPTLNQQGPVPTLEMYEYAGAYGFKDISAGDEFVRLRMKEIEAASKHFEASGDDDRVQPGRTFILTGHLDLALLSGDTDDHDFLILEVRHSISNNFETHEGGAAEYRSRLKCIRKKIPWHPGRGFNSTEPKIYGLQTAIVVGPEGEEIYTDEYGRACVQFHWDRQGGYDEKSSAWVRVASSMAGEGFGHVALPRVGEEVVVQWLQGCPDRPLITGRVYNADNMPPRFSHEGSLPANRALSGWSTREIRGTKEQQIRFDDTPGQISVQLASDHGHSQLNLGHLSQPRKEGEATPRGEGFELRSDDSGAIRSAKALLISAWKRLDASGTQMSSEEHLALMQDCLDLFKSLGQYAGEHQGLPVDTAPLAELKGDVKDAAGGSNVDPQGQGGKPTLSLTAPAGIALTTPKTLVSYAGVDIDSVAQQHMHYTVGQNFCLNAGKGISMFSQAGFKAIAHQGPFSIQSQHDDTLVDSAKNVQVRAIENVVLRGKTLSLIAEDGSFIKIGGGGITLGSNGAITQKAASFPHSGPSTLAAEVPTFSKGSPDQKFVLRYATGGGVGAADALVAANRRFEATLSDGSVMTGVSDAEGKTQLFDSASMHIANIRILKD